MSHFKEHVGLFWLLMKGIFGSYVLWPLDKKLIFWIVTRVSARDYTVSERILWKPLSSLSPQKVFQKKTLRLKWERTADSDLEQRFAMLMNATVEKLLNQMEDMDWSVNK